MNLLRPDLQTPTHPKIKPLFPKTNQIITLDPNGPSEERFNPNLTKLKRDRVDWEINALRIGQAPREYSRSLQKALKTQGNLSKLNYSFDIQRLSETKHYFSIISHLSSLPALDLIYLDSSTPQIPPIKPLLKALPLLKNLSSLQLCFYLIRFKDEKILSKIFECLRRLPKLTSLSLHFAFSTDLTTNQMDFFSASLGRLTKLRNLKLNFDSSFNLKAQDVDKLSTAFSKLHNLTKIELQFGIFIQKSTLQNLFISFQNLKKTLTDISLGLNGCAIVRGNNIKPLSGSLEYLDCSLVKRFSFAPYQGFNDESLIQLIKILKRSSYLEHLALRFPHFTTSFTDENFSELALAISEIQSLTSLDLLFPYFLKIKSAVFNIASALPSLKNLKNLKIEFSSNNETEDCEFEQLFLNIRLCKSLTYIYISADNEKKLTDRSLEVLGESLKDLIFLRSLYLNFKTAYEVSRQGKEFIISAIQKRKKLLNNSDIIFTICDNNRQ